MSARGEPKPSLITRRDFLKVAASTTALGSLGAFRLEAAAQESGPSFTFAYVSDTHLYEKKLNERFVRAIERAINDMNTLDPQPDFILFGGDLAQLGQPKELELGKEFLDQLKAPVKMMVGEHDWYLDMGDKWRDLFGKDIYSFDHKGVHFVVLNSVIVDDYWTEPGMTPMERMKFMAQLDNPNGRPFTVGEEQREWLKDDLSRVNKSIPLIVFSHSPLYKYYKPWNFWTDDAEQVQAILNEFNTVTVVHGHTHQLLTNQTGNITFHGMLSTAWPWPYAPEGIPNLTIQMDRADPFDQFDGCGDGTADVLPSGQINKRYNLWARKPRLVTYEGVRRLWSTRGIGLFEPGPSY
ncbi:MAG: metallophosphoesterase [Candidatus Brocadiales bacterium]